MTDRATEIIETAFADAAEGWPNDFNRYLAKETWFKKLLIERVALALEQADKEALDEFGR